MIEELKMVEEFHRRSGNPIAEEPFLLKLTARGRLLRARLVAGEAAELIDALHAEDLALEADALCDLLYVTLGTALALGLAPILPELFREVHRSNLTKDFKSNPADEGGSRVLVKGPGYEPPRLAELLAAWREKLRAEWRARATSAEK